MPVRHNTSQLRYDMISFSNFALEKRRIDEGQTVDVVSERNAVQSTTHHSSGDCIMFPL